ncbi:MAG: S8/S53 family peptidase [Actinomycetota bacterium]
MRYPQDATYTTWVKPARDVYNNTGEHGQLGHVFRIDSRTWGGAFVLTPTGGTTGDEDVDITFYSDLAPEPGSSAVSPGASEARGPGDERGVVPSSSTHAIVTLFYGANAEFIYTAFAPVTRKALRTSLPKPPKRGIHASYGKAKSALATSFKKKSHVVIAVVDTGINPYHVSYRRPDRLVHPSQYIEGFPKDAPALGLNLTEKNYVKARNGDDAPVWSKTKERKLYWIPGTNIIGAYSQYDYWDDTPGIGDTPITGVKNMPRPVIDDSGHGTGTTSVSGGGIYGSNPDALIVSVEGLGPDSVKWAANQPWIDVISGSYGDPAAVPYNKNVPKLPAAPQPAGELDGREYEATGPFVLRDGRTACFSAGNGLTRTGAAYDRYSSIRPTSGPSWVITVGAASPRNDQDYGWHSVPVDVSSYGLHWPAADYASTDGSIEFSGTSSATPITCGVFSKALLEARRALGDTREGIHTVRGERVPAAGRRSTGLLNDGVLTRKELQDAVLKTAMPAQFDATTYSYEPVPSVPHTPAYYTQEGYGVANKASAMRAVRVILGRDPMPDRTEVDRWIETIDMIRNQLWNPSDYD